MAIIVGWLVGVGYTRLVLVGVRYTQYEEVNVGYSGVVGVVYSRLDVVGIGQWYRSMVPSNFVGFDHS